MGGGCRTFWTNLYHQRIWRGHGRYKLVPAKSRPCVQGGSVQANWRKLECGSGLRGRARALPLEPLQGRRTRGGRRHWTMRSLARRGWPSACSWCCFWLRPSSCQCSRARLRGRLHALAHSPRSQPLRIAATRQRKPLSWRTVTLRGGTSSAWRA
jgi:hypothetical protein